MECKIPWVQWQICWPCRQHFKCSESYNKHKLLCNGVKKNPDLVVKEHLKPYLRPSEDINSLSVVDTRKSFFSQTQRINLQLQVQHGQSFRPDIIKHAASRQAVHLNETQENLSEPNENELAITPKNPVQTPKEGQFAERAGLKSVLFRCLKCDEAFRFRIQLNRHLEAHNETEAKRKVALGLRIQPSSKSANEACQKPSSVPVTPSKPYCLQVRRIKGSHKADRRRQSHNFNQFKTASDSARNVGNTLENVKRCMTKKARLNHKAVDEDSDCSLPYDLYKNNLPLIPGDESETQLLVQNTNLSNASLEKPEAAEVPIENCNSDEDWDPSTSAEWSDQSERDISIKQNSSDENDKPERPIQLFDSISKRNGVHSRVPLVKSETPRNQKTVGRSPYGFWLKFLQRQRGSGGKDVFQCDRCDKSYKGRWGLKQHLLQVHKVGEGLSCSFCPSKFVDSKCLKRHIVKHAKEKNFLCDFCGKSYSFMASLLFHQKYSCKFVEHREDQEQDQAERSLLKDHMMVHTKKDLTCHDCGSSFNYESSFVEHQKHQCLNRHLNEDQELGGRITRQVDAGTQHESGKALQNVVDEDEEIPTEEISAPNVSQTQPECQVRGKGKAEEQDSDPEIVCESESLSSSTKTQKSSANVFEFEHESSHVQIKPPTTIKPFKCQNCKAEFSRIRQLGAHKCFRKYSQKQTAVDSFSPADRSEVSIRRHDSGIAVQFNCESCGRNCGTEMGLKCHECLRHDDDDSWLCDRCGQSYSENHALLDHQQTSCNSICPREESEQDQLECQEPSFQAIFKFISQQKSLKQIILPSQTLQGEEADERAGLKTTLFPCHICNQKFRLRIQRNQHVETHYEIRVATTQQQRGNKDVSNERGEKPDGSEEHLATGDSDEHWDASISTVRSQQPESESGTEEKSLDRVKKPLMKSFKSFNLSSPSNELVSRVRNLESKNLGNQETERQHPKGFWSQFIHQRKETGAHDLFQCNRCGQNYRSLWSVKRHLVVAHGIGRGLSCTFCPRKFLESFELSRHMVVHTKEKCFSCDFCGKSYTQKHNLSFHQDGFCKGPNHTGKSKKQKQTKYTPPVSNYAFQCDRCDRSYNCRDSLKYHLLHVHIVGQSFSCSICSRKFLYRSRLRWHMKAVHGVQPSAEEDSICNNSGRSSKRKKVAKFHQDQKYQKKNRSQDLELTGRISRQTKANRNYNCAEALQNVKDAEEISTEQMSSPKTKRDQPVCLLRGKRNRRVIQRRFQTVNPHLVGKDKPLLSTTTQERSSKSTNEGCQVTTSMLHIPPRRYSLRVRLVKANCKSPWKLGSQTTRPCHIIRESSRKVGTTLDIVKSHCAKKARLNNYSAEGFSTSGGMVQQGPRTLTRITGTRSKTQQRTEGLNEYHERKWDENFILRIQAKRHTEAQDETEAIRKVALGLRIQPSSKSANEACKEPSSVPVIPSKPYCLPVRRMKGSHEAAWRQQASNTNRSKAVSDSSTKTGVTVDKKRRIMKKARLKLKSVDRDRDPASSMADESGKTLIPVITGDESISEKSQLQVEKTQLSNEQLENPEVTQGPIVDCDNDEDRDHSASTEWSEQSKSDSSIERNSSDEKDKSGRPIQIFDSISKRNGVHSRVPLVESETPRDQKTVGRSPYGFWFKFLQRRRGSGGKDVFQCNRCDKSYKGRRGLRYHLLHVHNVGKCFSCSFCPRKFNSNSDLKLHMVLHAKEKSFLCDFCGISFAWKHTLVRHQKYVCTAIDQREEQEQDQPECPGTVPKEKFQCDRCDKSYKGESSLRKHLLQAHSVGKSLWCCLCPRKFSYSCELRLHMATHTNEGWTCGNCGRGFRWERSFVEHQRHRCPCRFPDQEQKFSGRDSRLGNGEGNYEGIEAPEKIVEEVEKIVIEQLPSVKTNKDQSECQEGAKR